MTDIAPVNAPAAPAPTGPAPGTEIELATIKHAMADQRSIYWTGPRINGETLMQRRFAELMRGAPAAPPSSNAVVSPDVELAELKKMMADDSSEYWNGPMAEKNQARALELMAPKPKPSATVTALPPRPEVTAAWSSPAGKEIMAEWQRSGGFQHHRIMANKMADDIVAEIPADSREDFALGWSLLPPDAGIAVMAELTNPHGTMKQRIERVIRRCASDASADRFAHFINSMTPQEFAVIERRFNRR